MEPRAPDSFIGDAVRISGIDTSYILQYLGSRKHYVCHSEVSTPLNVFDRRLRTHILPLGPLVYPPSEGTGWCSSHWCVARGDDTIGYQVFYICTQRTCMISNKTALETMTDTVAIMTAPSATEQLLMSDGQPDALETRGVCTAPRQFCSPIDVVGQLTIRMILPDWGPEFSSCYACH